MKKDLFAKSMICLMGGCLLYLAYFAGDMAAEPTRRIMAELATKTADGKTVIDHCANAKKQ